MAVKKNIRFTDLDDNVVEEEWYFKLDQTDVIELDFIHSENVSEYFDKIMKEKNTREMLRVYKEMIFRSVGKRVNNRLVKSDAITEEFRSSGAYNQFFAELMESDDGGVTFFMSIMPANVQEQITEEQNKTFTKDELLAMSDGEFQKVAGTDIRNMTREHMQIAMQRLSKAA